MEEGRGEFGDAGPGVTGAAGAFGGDEVAPCGYALDDVEEVADLGGFESCAFDAGFVEREGGVEEAAEVEAAAGGEHGAEFCGALLLLGDPGEVGGRFEGEDPGSSQEGEGAVGDVVAEPEPFEGGGAGFGEWRRNVG